MPKTIIEVENLSKKYTIGERAPYGSLREEIMKALTFPFKSSASRSAHLVSDDNIFWALKDVSFNVQEGEVIGIIGKNGAGKSTLLKILSRITEPSSGEIRISGRVGSLLEVGTGFHPELTGRENIFLNGSLLGMSKQEIRRKFDEIVAFAEIERFLDTPVKRYSSGMYVRLAFAVAAHLEPEILLVDEVLAVGDAAFQKKCLNKMGEVSTKGRTVLFVSHNMATVQSLCSQGILLENGQVYQFGQVENVIDTYMQQIIQKSSENTNKAFPVCNQTYGISIKSCTATVIQDNSDEMNLKIEMEIEPKRRIRNIGVGLSLTSLNGTKVSVLGPSLTNFVIEEINDSCRCVFHCKGVNKYLAGGEYVIGVWLSKPRTEYLVRVEQAALLNIPPQDVFSSGVYFEEQYHGVVPLPIKFSIEKGHTDV